MNLEDQVIAPGPDIDNLDLSKADRGNNIPEPEDPKVAAAEPEEPEAEETEAEEPGGEEPGAELARDEKGRFKGKEAKVPKSRFDEQVGKERAAREAAEARAAELERQLAERTKAMENNAKIEELENQIASLEKKHAELLLDGDVEAAAQIMREIRHAERRIAKEEAVAETSSHIARTLEAERVEAIVARLEADYDEFNPQSENYDQDLVELVLSKQKQLIEQQGMSPSKALEKAGREVANRFLSKAEPEAGGKGLSAGKTATDRKEAQVAKNLDTQRRQSPSMKDAGMDSDKAGIRDKIDVTKLTPEEFAALPEATKAKLRGDLL